MGKIMCRYKSDLNKSIVNNPSRSNSQLAGLIDVRQSKTTQHYRDNQMPTFVKTKYQAPHAQQIQYEPVKEESQENEELIRLTERLLQDIDTLHYVRESSVSNLEELVDKLTSQIDPEEKYIKGEQIQKAKQSKKNPAIK